MENITIARRATVNELVVYRSMKHADASIIREDLVVNSEKMEIVEIPREQNIIKVIPIGTLVFSEQKDVATKFVDFVASRKEKRSLRNTVSQHILMKDMETSSND